ncbi:MAG: hypothetical protein CM15mP62_11980 [Rhodospirillaceae bacterium]|nr:MAG: hypothetical protein CM15mP62_11980 [Rhodospirillaceae bacterium]
MEGNLCGNERTHYDIVVLRLLTGVEVPEEKTLDILKDLGFKVSGRGEKLIVSSALAW